MQVEDGYFNLLGMKLERGYVHVYMGNGKGKSTAAFGLALRAAGAGLHVFIGQFLKGVACGELEAFKRFEDRVTFRQYGTGVFVRGKPAAEDIAAARAGLGEIRQVVTGGDCDLVVLDEASEAVTAGVLAVDDLLDLIERKPVHVELVFTGRHADDRLLARADLVTEMRAVRHYHDAGVKVRKGIEI